jgi:hypothetical protein
MFKTLGEYQEHVRKLKEDPDYAQKWKEQKEKNIRNYWMELKPFKKAEDVPNLPTMNDFYVKRLIELGAIPKEKLKDGVWYYGNYRNSVLGKWDAQKEKFGLWRHKFGWMWDTCNHFQNDDRFALFVPLREANEQELEQIKKIEDEKLR